MSAEGKYDTLKTDTLDINSQIAIKRSLIESVVGKEDSNKLFEEINNEPKKYIGDSRKIVRELATLTLSASSKDISMTDLYSLIQGLQSQITDLQNNQIKKWVHVGHLNDIEKLVKQYSALEYEYGIRHNSTLSCVHPIIFNSWNRGIRISTRDSYPMGDNQRN